MSSSSPPPPPPPGPPPGPPPPGSTPSTGGPGSPPPPPPLDNADPATSITSANYFFGFVITFVVLFLLFVGCGIRSMRHFRLVGTAWDDRLQDMDGVTFPPRKRGRRRLVKPIFAEAWTHPRALRELAVGNVMGKNKWEGVQPVSAAFVWSRSVLSAFARKVKVSQRTARGEDDSIRGVGAMLGAYVFPRRPRCEHPPRPPPIPGPPPEAIQVAVMIAMPSPPASKPTSGPHSRKYVGHAALGEYQIGVVRIPWPSGEGPLQKD